MNLVKFITLRLMEQIFLIVAVTMIPLRVNLKY